MLTSLMGFKVMKKRGGHLSLGNVKISLLIALHGCHSLPPPPSGPGPKAKGLRHRNGAQPPIAQWFILAKVEGLSPLVMLSVCMHMCQSPGSLQGKIYESTPPLLHTESVDMQHSGPRGRLTGDPDWDVSLSHTGHSLKLMWGAPTISKISVWHTNGIKH